MPFGLQDLTVNAQNLSPADIVSRLIISAILGLIVGLIYHLSQRKSISDSFSFIVTMVLLTILVAMTTLVIGDSTARAFGLVGALSIVRFRTIVDDTRDTAFVIFAVVVGMAAGAGIAYVYVIGVPIVSLVSMGMSLAGRRLDTQHLEQRLEIRVEGSLDPEKLFSEVFRQHLIQCRLSAASTARQGASLDLQYVVQLSNSENTLQFVKTLAQLDGVQSVELK